MSDPPSQRWRLRSIRIAAVALLVALWSCEEQPQEQADAELRFVDESSCADCHEAQYQAWTGSHHDLAMQDATEQAVLGAFDGARHTYDGVTSRFFRRDGRFFVNTDGPDGRLADFEIKHTFGAEPLQQYLIELSGGRLQALSIAWDTDRKRWFHLYPGEHVDYRDELHWTKPAQNWNHMCGECHATGYRKGYVSAASRYETTAVRFDVGCQACHGPAARHVEDEAGFGVDLAADSRVEIETCARCHSRRATLTADYRHGAPLMNTHLPALLEEPLYYADGQIRDEVYVYGSFLQSRMHAKGMRCSDCHDPHSTELRASGNRLCVSCHNAAAPGAGTHVDTSTIARKNYDSPEHHFHDPGKPGSHCVDCHAPARTYMVVDPRRDHSFRVPRPDLSQAIGTPNACNGCHTEKSQQWAADQVAHWYGSRRAGESHYGVAIDAGRNARSGAVRALVTLVGDGSQPAIVRATAIELLARYPGRSTLLSLRRALNDPDPLVRRAAVIGCEQLAPAQRTTPLLPLLDDPVLAVRIETARLLAPASASLASEHERLLERALAEFVAIQEENADRPEALANLGNLHAGRGELERAEASYRAAMKLDPRFVPAYVNLADLYRASGRDAEAESVLREGLRSVPDGAALHEALGLALVRQGRSADALAAFAAAVAAAPDSARHTYVYAVALFDAGERTRALEMLEVMAAQRGDRDILLALASFAHELGELDKAGEALRRLAAVNPDDPALAELSATR